jgi:hypothetical protein
LLEIHQALKTAEARRTELKKPITQIGKAIDQVAASVCDPMEAAKKTIQGHVIAWNRAEAARVEAERRAAEEEARKLREAAEKERRAQEEAARKAKEEQDRLAKAEAEEAEALGLGPVVVTPAPVVPPPAPLPVIVARPVAAAAVSSSVLMKKVKKLEVYDARKVAEAYEIAGKILVSCNEAAIKALIEAGIEVPGARMIEVEQMAMGRGR